MSELFEVEVDDEDLGDETGSPADVIDIDTSEITILDARRRLEKLLEEKRLRDELDDFVDY
ncbi:MAG: hypothetical protein Q8M03_03470 [Legionella sp.]|nr:hypothetical protein [Legionella sp.]